MPRQPRLDTPAELHHVISRDSGGLKVRCPVRKSGQKDNCCHMKMENKEGQAIVIKYLSFLIKSSFNCSTSREQDVSSEAF